VPLKTAPGNPREMWQARSRRVKKEREAAAQGQKDGLASPVAGGNTDRTPEGNAQSSPKLSSAAEAMIAVAAARARKPKVGM
jgi:hypothetical protein